MLTERKDVIAVVKETLQPFYKNYNLSHDDFKNIAKESTSKILPNGGGTAAEIKSVVHRTLLEQSHTTSVSAEGRDYLRSIVSSGGLGGGGGDDGGDGNNNNNNGDAGGGDGALFVAESGQNSHEEENMTPADELISVDKFKAFMAAARARRQAALEDGASSRRPRE